jgi:DNA modification methylase
MVPNWLHYGDNVDVLPREVVTETVDLVYLDPPFNSNQDYNVLFAARDGTRATDQIKAFEDTWQWDEVAAATYQEVVEHGPPQVSQVMQAFRTFLGDNDMLAYLSMMAPRLVELRRVLKSTGSLYLHCDPTASHYLKLLLDSIFGPEQFRSEIVWKRSGAHSDSKQGRKNYGHIHDVILFYTKSDQWTWNLIHTPYTESYVGRDYQLIEEGSGRRYRRDNLTAARGGGDTEYLWRVKKHQGVRERWQPDLHDEYLSPRTGWEYKGVPPYRGRYWAYSLSNMRHFAHEGRIRHTYEGMPEYKRYLDEMPGVALQDIWTDVTPIISGTAERLGYPTQKPVALLERIIQASTNPGDLVLDPFCGCGTTIEAAENLGRRWIGIDITICAIDVITERLARSRVRPDSFRLKGLPKTLQEAEALARHDRYQFQWWALQRVGVDTKETKRGPDHGIDGRIYFHPEGAKRGKSQQVIVSVKSGDVTLAHLRELSEVVRRERAQIGVLVTLRPPTRGMLKAIADGEYYQSPWGKHKRLQIITVTDLFAGARIDYPWMTAESATRQQPRKKKSVPLAEQRSLPLVTDPEAIRTERAEAAARRRALIEGVPSRLKRGKGQRAAPAPAAKRPKR